MKRTHLWSGLALAVAVPAIALWLEAGRVPELASPLALADAWALSDGGSMYIDLVDANGTRFAFGVRGSLDIPRDQFPVYVLRWAPAPLFRDLGRGSSEERQLAVLARRAAADNVKNLNHAMFLIQMAETLEKRANGS